MSRKIVSGFLFLMAFQVDSIVFVHAPVSGFLNSMPWLKVRWVYPSLSRQSYAFQESERIVVPGFTRCLIIGINVEDDLSSTTWKKNFLTLFQCLQ